MSTIIPISQPYMTNPNFVNFIWRPYNYDLDSVLNLTASADRKTDQSSQEIVSIDKYFQQEIDEKFKKFFEKEKKQPETEMSSVNSFEETIFSPIRKFSKRALLSSSLYLSISKSVFISER